MTVRNRAALALLWALSLVAVSRWTANAEQGTGNVTMPPSAQAPTSPALPGYEVRFVPTTRVVRGQEMPMGGSKGSLMAYVNGQWVFADVSEDPVPRVRPLN